jgi:phospho-N-acetylmuramoyl-pentapeptide-transferase
MTNERGIKEMTEQLIDFRYIFAVILSFSVTAILGPFMIPVLRRLKVGNTEREELKSHQKKTGTPTMGGLMILLSIIITSLFFISSYPKIVPILFVTVGFGVIGFFDDYLKVVLKRSDGLFAWQKMILEIVVTAVFAIYLQRFSDVPLTMLIPFSGGKYADFGWLALPILFLAVIGTVNGANFTDGLDGLASSVTVLIATFFSVVAVGTNSGIEPVTCAVVGALLGFLLFNVYPASVFMGDTGSLALGGFVASVAYMMQMPMFILIVGLIYWIEILSVMIQVGYFKMTHGKRFFRMAPIHHHFELGGWSETRVVAVFSIVTTILCLVAYMGM